MVVVLGCWGCWRLWCVKVRGCSIPVLALSPGQGSRGGGDGGGGGGGDGGGRGCGVLIEC